MAFEVMQGAFATLEVLLEPGESVLAESDACVTRLPSVFVEGFMSGGLLRGMARKLVGGESLFLQKIQCGGAEGGSAVLAPKDPGHIGVYEPAEAPLLMRHGAFLAASSTVEVTTKALLGRQFLIKAGFSGNGLFCLRASGSGKVVFSACGALMRYDLCAGEERVVDNNHVAAWTERMDYRIGTATDSMWHSVSSGEGLCCFFKGPGTVFVQSHAPQHPASRGDPHPNDSCCGALSRQLVLVGMIVSLYVIVHVVFGSEGVDTLHRWLNVVLD